MVRTPTVLRLLPLLALVPLGVLYGACTNFYTISPPLADGAPPPLADGAPPPLADGAPPADASVLPDATTVEDAAPIVKSGLVFVTSFEVNGAFAAASIGTAPDEASRLCKDDATKATLAGANWIAYLSTSTASVFDRLPTNVAWYLPTATGTLGPQVFASRSVIPNGPEVPINVTAKGVSVPSTSTNYGVWTGTAADGSRTNLTCDNWHDVTFVGSQGDWRVFGAGNVGWTASVVLECSRTARFYCFQVP